MSAVGDVGLFEPSHRSFRRPRQLQALQAPVEKRRDPMLKGDIRHGAPVQVRSQQVPTRRPRAGLIEGSPGTRKDELPFPRESHSRDSFGPPRGWAFGQLYSGCRERTAVALASPKINQEVQRRYARADSLASPRARDSPP